MSSLPVTQLRASPYRIPTDRPGLTTHGYAEVNDERVVEILKTRLGDLDRFRTALAEAVSRPPPR